MHYFRNGLEVVLGILAVTLVSAFLCYAWPDRDYGLSGWMQAVAGWVQAVGSILAILYAVRIAGSQAQRQFEDARRLQRIDQAHAAFSVGKSTTAIASNVLRSLGLIIDLFGRNRTTVMLIADRQSPFDRHVLSEMRADLDAIQLHELPSSRLVVELLAMRSSIRNTTARIESALDNSRTMDGTEYQAFFDYLDRAYEAFSNHVDETERIADSILAEIRELGR
jgi:hypothetical protein